MSPFQALFYPISYRRICSALYANISLSSAFLIACVDLLLEFTLSPIRESHDCGTIGCFVSDSFLRYWGASNMALGGIIITISTILIFKLQMMGRKSQSNAFSTRDANVYAQTYMVLLIYHSNNTKSTGRPLKAERPHPGVSIRDVSPSN
ncbi:unnamed protein product [Cylicostephanus goldi]|uniref:Uncharacterized protein n=1 Tax=Cylicostephanus goldi TaxID=71465 RepID=A0A3P6RJS9_CYLGO|nr:unnamed protein product [Cylicostephanus goldi]